MLTRHNIPCVGSYIDKRSCCTVKKPREEQATRGHAIAEETGLKT